MAAEEPILVFFGIETSDYEKDCEILQIYMKSGTSIFNKYINPKKEISEDVSKVSHLRVHESKLYRDEVEKRTWPVRVVLKDLLQFLKQFGRPCTLVAHRYCYCNSYRLTRVIKKEMFENKFKNVIAGFTDTLDLFSKQFPDKEPKQLTMHMLAKETGLTSERPYVKGRSIKDNTHILEQLALHHFTAAELIAQRTFAQELKKLEKLAAGPFKKKPKKVIQSSRIRKGDRRP